MGLRRKEGPQIPEIQNQCQCTVPLGDVLGPITSDEAAAWAAREGVELRRSWDGPVALSVDDARVVHERASAGAEAARLRNQAKAAALAASMAPIPTGRPAVEGVDAAASMMEDYYNEKLAYKEEVRGELLEAERQAAAAKQDNADRDVVGAFTFRPFRRD